MADFFESFKKILTVANLMKYLHGLEKTIIISALAVVIGIVIGVILAMINYLYKKTGKFKILSVLVGLVRTKYSSQSHIV